MKKIKVFSSILLVLCFLVQSLGTFSVFAANSTAKPAADTYSARPGHSEHQTGLSADINSVETSWGKTPEGKWLAANCYKYGFIIRYPA